MRGRAATIVALLLTASPAVAHAELRLAVMGHGVLRRALAARMIARGFTIDPEARSSAEISGGRRTLTVTATDEHGRAAEREVPDLDVAADWIESWVRSDLLSPLLPQPQPQPRRIAPLRPVEPAPLRTIFRPSALHVVRETASREAQTHARRRCPTQLLSRAEATYGGERMYGGASLGAATMLAAPCVGVEGRAAATQLATVAGGIGRRMLAELLMQVGWPFLLGPIDLSPRLAFGPGLHHSWREDLTRTDTMLLIELAVIAALPLSDRTALELALSGTVPLFADHQPLFPGGTANPGDPNFEKIASTGLEGTPRWMVRLGVGVRVDVGGAP